MNVRELIAALSKLDPDLPVVIEQEDIELVGAYVELMRVEYADDLVYRDPKEYAGDGKGYSNPEHHYKDSTPTDPVVIVSFDPRKPPTIDGEIAPLEIEP